MRIFLKIFFNFTWVTYLVNKPAQSYPSTTRSKIRILLCKQNLYEPVFRWSIYLSQSFVFQRIFVVASFAKIFDKYLNPRVAELENPFSTLKNVLVEFFIQLFAFLEYYGTYLRFCVFSGKNFTRFLSHSIQTKIPI